MNKLGKLGKNGFTNYIVHKREMSFKLTCSGKLYHKPQFFLSLWVVPFRKEKVIKTAHWVQEFMKNEQPDDLLVVEGCFLCELITMPKWLQYTGDITEGFIGAMGET